MLDGEVSVFDREGVSRFQLLQNLGAGKSVFAVFDCLYKDGQDLRRRPLSERRVALEQSLASNKLQNQARNKAIKNKSLNQVIVPSSRLASNGLEAYRLAMQRKFEGLVAKDLSSPYVEGRSRFWLKVKVHQQDEFVIGGFTKPTGSRSHFGALLLGAYDRSSKLRFVGKVGTGFNEQSLATLFKKFRPLVRKQSPFVDPPRDRDVTFLAPKLVAQISYQEWTADKKLRQPVFLGLRDDKSPQEVRMPEFAA